MQCLNSNNNSLTWTLNLHIFSEKNHKKTECHGSIHQAAYVNCDAERALDKDVHKIPNSLNLDTFNLIEICFWKIKSGTRQRNILKDMANRESNKTSVDVKAITYVQNIKWKHQFPL